MTNAEPAKPYAVVETGGKQYLVQQDTTFEVELLDAEKGQQVELKPVLAISDGNKLTIGTPVIAGAKVVATVVDQIRGEKVVSFKRKRRKGYHRKHGHRQDLLVVKVVSIA